MENGFSIRNQYTASSATMHKISYGFYSKKLFHILLAHLQLEQKFMESYPFCIYFRSFLHLTSSSFHSSVPYADTLYVFYLLMLFGVSFISIHSVVLFQKKNNTPKSHKTKTKQHRYLNKECRFLFLFSFSEREEGGKTYSHSQINK